MDTHQQNPTEVSDRPPPFPGQLLIDFIIAQRGQDLIFKQVVISQTLFQQTLNSAVSETFSQTETRFSPEEQTFIEQTIYTYAGMIRSNNITQIYVYVMIVDTVTKDDGKETATFCIPFVCLAKPCERKVEEYTTFSGAFWTGFLELGRSRLKLRQRKVSETIHKYGDSLRYEEVKEVSNMNEECSICLKEYWNGCQSIRLPCDHMFCARCSILWLLRNGSCPLCRYKLVPESHALQW